MAYCPWATAGRQCGHLHTAHEYKSVNSVQGKDEWAHSESTAQPCVAVLEVRKTTSQLCASCCRLGDHLQHSVNKIKPFICISSSWISSECLWPELISVFSVPHWQLVRLRWRRNILSAHVKPHSPARSVSFSALLFLVVIMPTWRHTAHWCGHTTHGEGLAFKSPLVSVLYLCVHTL